MQWVLYKVNVTPFGVLCMCPIAFILHDPQKNEIYFLNNAKVEKGSRKVHNFFDLLVL